ncbi:MAG: phosphopantothenate/pantothenate synthetase, partial [Thermoplasmata archaeon]
ADGYENDLVDRTGLIAHGRGEAFDYLLGERTHPEAELSAKVAAAHLLLAKNPVISVNGNTAVLVPDELVELAKVASAKIEVNIFHRTEDRLNKLVSFLEAHGAGSVLGLNPDAKLPDLSSQRALCTREGIFSADVILVPLEDGDRAEVLAKMEKTVIVVDLNPLSRSARYGTVTIVDNICRTIRVIIDQVKDLKQTQKEQDLNRYIEDFNNEQNLKQMILHLKEGEYQNYK